MSDVPFGVSSSPTSHHCKLIVHHQLIALHHISLIIVLKPNKTSQKIEQGKKDSIFQGQKMWFLLHCPSKHLTTMQGCTPSSLMHSKTTSIFHVTYQATTTKKINYNACLLAHCLARLLEKQLVANYCHRCLELLVIPTCSGVWGRVHHPS